MQMQMNGCRSMGRGMVGRVLEQFVRSVWARGVGSVIVMVEFMMPI